MKKINYHSLGIDVYETLSSNGMKTIIVPLPLSKTTLAGVYVSVGGFAHLEEVANTKIPQGFAHFLEHKLFDTPTGDGLMRLQEVEASGNAYTSSAATVYHFSTAADYKKPLKIIFDMVSHLTFSEEAVEKEKGIIIEESQMTLDNPNHALLHGLLKNIYFNSPIKEPILGTKDDIKNIHLSTLKKLFKEYYGEKNMTTFIVGNVDPQEALKAIESYDFKNVFQTQSTRVLRYQEPYLTCKKSYEEKDFPISNNILGLGFKLPPRNEMFEKFGYYTIAIYQIIESLLIGASSKLNEILENKQLIISEGSGQVIEGGEDASLVFEFMSDKPEELRAELIKQFEHPEKLFSNKELKAEKNKILGTEIRNVINAEDLFYSLTSSYENNISYPSLLERIKELKMSMMKKFIKILKNAPSSYYLLKGNGKTEL